MQCIAGIHYNYSLHEDVWRVLADASTRRQHAVAVDFQSERYFARIRNFRRTSWLLMYLFGASPALSTRASCAARATRSETLFDADTLYLPYATSLRMSDLGYSNDPAQSALCAGYDTLDGYLDALAKAVSQPYPPYEAIGTQRDGEWMQINTNVLQIENEFYSTIRPKRVIHPGERPLHALASRGVQYVEVRCLDIDPFEPTGISLETSRFLDAYLLFCALDDSPVISVADGQVHARNFARTVKEGRKPGLTLTRDGNEVSLQAWADELIERIRPVAALLDAQHNEEGVYATSLSLQKAKIANPALTPSAKVLDEVRALGSFGCVWPAPERTARGVFPRRTADAGRRSAVRRDGRHVAGRPGHDRSGRHRQLRRFRGSLQQQHAVR